MRTPRPLLFVVIAWGSAALAACSSTSPGPASTDGGGAVADAADATADGALDGEVDDAPGDSSNPCNHPPTTTYSCSSLPNDEGACVGGPPQAGDAGGGASYPIGCVATVPACNAFYPGQPLTCTCTPLGMMASWACGA
jgi:hypothetical protein